MDTALKMDKVELQTLVWRGVGVREVTMEYIVPDSRPDVGQIADAQGLLTVQGKDTDAGAVQLSASLAVSVLYVPENGEGLCGLDITLPADVRLDAPGADMDCRTTAGMRVRLLEARAVNSRKLALRAELEAEAACYRAGELSVAADVTGAEGVQLLRQEAAFMPVSDVREKTFALTDDIALPAGCGSGAAILARRAEIVPEEAQYVGGKVLFRGRIRADLVFSGEDGRVRAGRYETEYSQLMEVTASAEDALPEMTLFLTGAYFDLPEYGQDGDRLRAEYHLAAQCVCRERRTLTYVADLYSNRTELVPATERLSLPGSVRPIVMRQTVADRTEGPAPGGELLFSSAAVGAVVPEGDALRCSVSLRLVYAEAGGISAARARVSAEFTLPELSGDEILRDISVSVADLFCVPGTGDIRVTLRLDALAEHTAEIAAVSGVTEDEAAWQARERTPSAVLLWAKPGTDIWGLARRFRSTVDDILAVNEGRREGLLLIPKGR